MSAKVLLVSWAVPPQPTGAAVVVGNLARQFSRDEMVVAGNRMQGHAPSMTWRNDWPEIRFLTFGLPRGWRGARWWHLLQFPLLLWRLNRLARQTRCEVLFVVFPDAQYLLAAYLVARWRRLRFFPHFHNTYLDNRTGLPRLLAAWLQPRVFAFAEHVFVMSEGMREYYARVYPGLDCSALVHSFNDRPAVDPAAESPTELSRPLRLVMFGTLNQSCADAASRFAELVRRRPDYKLQICSGTGAHEFAAIGFTGDNVRHDTVSLDKLLSTIRESDIVLFPHGFRGNMNEVEFETIFPTKTIEALLSGRPILAHMPVDCFITRWLRQYDCADIVDQPDTTMLEAALDRLAADPGRRRTLVANAQRAVEQFYAPRVAAKLRSHIDAPSQRS